MGVRVLSLFLHPIALVIQRNHLLVFLFILNWLFSQHFSQYGIQELNQALLYGFKLHFHISLQEYFKGLFINHLKRIHSQPKVGKFVIGIGKILPLRIYVLKLPVIIKMLNILVILIKGNILIVLIIQIILITSWQLIIYKP